MCENNNGLLSEKKKKIEIFPSSESSIKKRKLSNASLSSVVSFKRSLYPCIQKVIGSSILGNRQYLITVIWSHIMSIYLAHSTSLRQEMVWLSLRCFLPYFSNIIANRDDESLSWYRSSMLSVLWVLIWFPFSAYSIHLSDYYQPFALMKLYFTHWLFPNLNPTK